MLRQATDDDLMTMLGWRNHAKVRAASLTTHEITPAEHHGWWAAVAGDPARAVLIYEQAGVPRGVVIFTDLRTDPATGRRCAQWSYYLDTDGVEAADLGLRVWVELEREALDHAFDQLGVQELRGVTLADNVAVRQLHRRFGFAEVESFEHEIDGVPTPIVRTELQVENRRR